MFKGSNSLLDVVPMQFTKQDNLRVDSPLNRDEKYMLTSAQRRIWLVEKIWGEDELALRSNNISIAFDFYGEICCDTLKRAVEIVFADQEIFYSYLFEDEGEPSIALKDTLGGDISVIELANDGLESFLEGAVNVTFDVKQGNSFSIKIIKVSKAHTILLLVMSHFVVDGWAVKLLFRHISRTYTSIQASQYLAVPSRKQSYKNISDQLVYNSINFKDEIGIKYWEQQLSNIPHHLEYQLLQSGISADESLFAGVGGSIVISEEILTRLKNKSRSMSVSLSTIVFSAYAILMQRYIANEEFLLGLLVSGRTGSILNRKAIGSFFNTVPIRVSINSHDDVYEFIRKMHEVLNDAIIHSDIPFEDLVKLFSADRISTTSPLVQAIFSYEKAAHESLKLGDVKAKYRELNRGVTQNDIVFHCHEMSTGLLCTVDCKKQLFESWMISDFLDNFSSILERISGSECSVSQVSGISSRQIERILKWNDTACSFGNFTTIVEAFEAQVSLTPHAVALDFDGQILTYVQLYERSTIIAEIIVEKGLSGAVIGVHLGRSLNLFSAIYGVLRAGAVYLPIEPSLPLDRIEYMADASSCGLVLTDHDNFSLKSTQNIFLGEDFFADISGVKKISLPRVTPHDLAYVIFTSGSTGLPKGVMIDHYAISNRLEWMQAQFLLAPEERVLFKTPIGFDVSIWEIFWPLMFGGTIVIAIPDGHKDTSYLENLIIEKSINYAHFVPSMLSVFLETIDRPQSIAIKNVICSGEELSVELQKKFYEVLPGSKLINLYGPTEAAVDVSIWCCSQDPLLTKVPIGKPIANTQLAILDHNKQLSPIGAIGELYIGGANLGRGYINRPEETQDKFHNIIDSAFSLEKFYKTGDLCRYRSDGNIEYIGRSDFQIKIRGQRIEINEIEILLRSITNSVDCCVLPHKANNETVLVAFVKCSPGSPTITVDEIQKQLLLKLPEYMVPNEIILIDSIPTTLNGKIDRAILLEGVKKNKNNSSSSSIDCDVENEIKRICSRVVGINSSEIDASSSFFSIGGNSLLVNVLAKSIREHFGISLPVSKIFEFRSIREIGNYLKAHGASLSQNFMSESFEHAPKNSEFLSNLKGAMEGLARKYDVPGASIAVRDNQQLHVCAVGLRNTKKGVVLGHEHMFRIGCLVKLMTSSLAMIFLEEGHLCLDEPIRKRWKNFRVNDSQVSDSITLRHLLTHTAGLDDQYFLVNGLPEFTSLEDFLSRLQSCPQLSPLGSNVVYSSLGYLIIAYFLEFISGKKYIDLLIEKIFRPLNITEFSCPPFDNVNCANEGYIFADDGGLVEVAVPQVASCSSLLPAIGNDLMMSAAALLQFAESFLRNAKRKILTVDSIVLMTGYHYELRGDFGFCGVGFGFYHAQGGGVGLKGNGAGHQSFLNILPDRNMAIVLVGNKYPCEAMYMEVYYRLTGLHYIQQINNQEVFEIADVIGSYKSSQGGVAVRNGKSGLLHISRTGCLADGNSSVAIFDVSGICAMQETQYDPQAIYFYYKNIYGASYLNWGGQIFRRETE